MKPVPKPRQKALEVLRAFDEEGAFVDQLLEAARPEFDPRDNAFIRELVYGVLRNRGLLDWVLNLYSERPIDATDARTRNILRLGAYQMLFLDRVPVSAAVNTATDLAKRFGKKQGYVNGLLRTLDRNRASIRYPGTGDPVKRLTILASHPEWLVKRWIARFGEEVAESALKANNRPSPLTIRTNTLKITREGLKKILESQNTAVQETAYSPVGLDILSSPGIRGLSAYQDGLFMVQDQAAQLISLMLAPKPGETILDACAAPGGKTAHIAEIMENTGRVVALEIDPARMEKVRENSSRLGISIIEMVIEDAARYRHGMFDKVLVDAPCSGLGLLRRHPDTRWNKNEHSLKERQDRQIRILENCARILKPGGSLVYATCTTEPEENEEVIARFQDRAGEEFTIDNPKPHLPAAAHRLVDSRGYFRTFPIEPAMDGFFGVRMVKKS